MTDPKIAKLIDQGQSQTVVLPPDVRLPGDQVEVVQSGDTVTLTPVRKRKTLEEIEAWFAEIDKLAQGRFMEGGREQPPMPPDDDLSSFD
jgi:virulence-associated protein VagC